MMRIAQVAPLYERVPPRLYGGTERIVSYLTEELIRQGHEVTLFASGDSLTQARLIAPCERSLRLDPECKNHLIPHLLQLNQLLERAESFDMVHFHTDYVHFPFAQRLGKPHVTTLHGRLDLADLVPLFEEFAQVPLVSISDSQRAPLPSSHWQGTVYHGLPLGLYDVSLRAGTYLAFLGRIARKKESTAQSKLPNALASSLESRPRSMPSTSATWKRKFGLYWIIR